MGTREIKPIIVGDFHLFVCFKAKQDRRKFYSASINEDKKSPYVHDVYIPCTINFQGGIRVIANTDQGSVIDTCVPYPTEKFYTDFGEWDVQHEYCFPIPDMYRKEGTFAILNHLKYLQRVLDAHMLYWDTEGRPPLSQLTVSEVLAKYDPCGGEIK
jgi:hypothetical protein